MTRKITSTGFGLIAAYALFIGVQFFILQAQTSVNLINITTFFSFFVVFLVLFIVLYELIEMDRLVRMFFVFITIVNLNYFIIAFFLRMITIAEGGWAGEIYSLNMLFYANQFSVATLIEYNIFFKLPAILNGIGMAILLVMLYIRSKLW